MFCLCWRISTISIMTVEAAAQRKWRDAVLNMDIHLMYAGQRVYLCISLHWTCLMSHRQICLYIQYRVEHRHIRNVSKIPMIVCICKQIYNNYHMLMPFSIQSLVVCCLDCCTQSVYPIITYAYVSSHAAAAGARGAVYRKTKQTTTRVGGMWSNGN